MCPFADQPLYDDVPQGEYVSHISYIDFIVHGIYISQMSNLLMMI